MEEDLVVACVGGDRGTGRKVTVGACLEDMGICEGTEDDTEGRLEV